METPPRQTDPRALAARRARARGMADPAMFLQEDIADEIEERLAEVNRTFTAPAVVTPFPDLWKPRLPGARMVAEGETLDLSEGAQDLVIHALSLHWADDPVGQLVQCRRALAPDGLFLAALFGGGTLWRLRAALRAAEAEITGGLSPRIAPMGEIRDLGALLQRAGLALPVADGATRTVRYRDAFHLMHDLRAMGEANALAARHRVPAPRALFAEAARRYAADHADPEGRLPASFEIVFLTGWAPSETQQKPMRPGSASTRLADALDTEELRVPGSRTGRDS